MKMKKYYSILKSRAEHVTAVQKSGEYSDI